MPFTPAFRETVQHGRCVGVRLPGGSMPPAELDRNVLERLTPEERALAENLGPGRQLTWIGGRLAARAALDDLALPYLPILPDDRGAPVFPDGVRGSISHKHSLAVALVAADDGWTRGVDVEHSAGSPYDIASHVLTHAERAELASASEELRRSEVLFRFSAKEALYKALDPHVRRFVSFHEVSVVRDRDGGARFELDLAQGEGPFETELGYWSWEEMLLVTARVRVLTAS